MIIDTCEIIDFISGGNINKTLSYYIDNKVVICIWALYNISNVGFGSIISIYILYQRA